MKALLRLIQTLFSWLTALFTSNSDGASQADDHFPSKKIIERDQRDTGGGIPDMAQEEQLGSVTPEETAQEMDDSVADDEDDLFEFEEKIAESSEPEVPAPVQVPKKNKKKSRSRSRSVFSDEEEEESEIERSLPVEAVETAPASQGDIVNMTVYSPEQIEIGSSFLVSVFAHLYEQRKEVEEMAKEMDEENKRQGGKTLNTPISRGSQLSFRLSIEDWEIFDPVQSLVWFGQPSSVEFDIEVPESYQEKKAIGTLIVSNANGPVGRMRFNLAVTGVTSDDPLTDAPGFAETESQRYTQAYLSYAPEDQIIVDQHIEKLRANGIDAFLNVKEDSDYWEDHAIVALRQSELFLLFWSEAANQSEEVEVEYQTALGLRYGGEERLPDLVPIPIGTVWPDPPEDLAFLNFKPKQMAPNSLFSVNQEEEIEALKARCEQLISEGKVEVFDLMRTYYQEDDDLVNDLYSLENQWNTLKRKQRLKLWSKEQIQQTQSKLTFAVLGLIGEME